MKIIDLYSGIGGFRWAIEKIEKDTSCIFYSEIDKHAIETYNLNFNEKNNEPFSMDQFKDLDYGKIQEIIGDTNIDLLTAGFPCQTFSNAGHKKGFNDDDTRGTQFFNLIRVIEAIKPKYLILENVKHIVSHDNGKTFKTITELLKKNGYSLPLTPLIISPIDVGYPQLRNRIFMVSKLNEEKTFKFDKKEAKISSKQKFEYQDIIKPTKDFNNIDFVLSEKEITILEAWQEFMKRTRRVENKTVPVIWMDDIINKTKIDKNWQDWKIKYINDMMEYYNFNKEFIDKWIDKYEVKKWSKRDKKFEWHAGIDEDNLKETIISLRQSGIRCKKKTTFPTLVAIVQTPIIYDENLEQFRRLNPREVARLQGFDENYKLNKNNQQAYKQMGNTVNVKIIEEIWKQLKNF